MRQRNQRATATFAKFSQRDGFKKFAHLDHQVKDVSAKTKALVKAHGHSVEALLNCVIQQGTPVVIVTNMVVAIICFIVLGFESGYCPYANRPMFKALCKVLHLTGQLAPNHNMTHGLFLLTPPVLNIGFLSHQLHHWVAANADLPGYTQAARHLYRRFYQQAKGRLSVATMNTLSLDELKSLKSAIQRDREALECLGQMLAEWVSPKHTKLDNGDTLV
jgi:hypothetical protein